MANRSASCACVGSTLLSAAVLAWGITMATLPAVWRHSAWTRRARLWPTLQLLVFLPLIAALHHWNVLGYRY